MLKTRIIAVLILLLGAWVGVSVYQSEVNETNPFRLGLDLSGGSYLVYVADTSEVAEAEVPDAMDSLRDVIERRINAFGIAEPKVQTERHSIGVDGVEERLIVELPGVTDLDEAVELIGQTPLLEFRTEVSEVEQLIIDSEISERIQSSSEDQLNEEVMAQLTELQNRRYQNTELTGKYLRRAQLQFSQAGVHGGGLSSRPIVGISFDSEGADLFEDITRENIGKTIAIYLDGQLVSAPMVNTAISGGQAVIEGDFDIEEAKTLVGRLNSGALPIPIELISTSTIGPSLGQDAVDAGVYAGIVGLILVAIVLVLWYRLPGLIAVIALGVYTAFMLWMFKFIPVTLTSAGIAGFIISIGIAVDANILIFERLKEEIRSGASIHDAISTGFKRAWASIRDANISSIISAIILFWFGTPLIKGFALTFGLGIMVSMLTAITFTRLMLLSLNNKERDTKLEKFLYGSGFNANNK
jgi:preprotein translocase subunit SecD